jgi:hypothetical protein
MPSAVPQDVYPLATKDNRAIPLDIVRPRDFVFLAPNGQIARQESHRLLYCESVGGPALLSFQETLELPAANTIAPGLCYIPWGLIIAVAIPEDVQYLGCVPMPSSSAGANIGIAIQFIETWQAIDQPSSYQRRF